MIGIYIETLSLLAEILIAISAMAVSYSLMKTYFLKKQMSFWDVAVKEIEIINDIYRVVDYIYLIEDESFVEKLIECVKWDGFTEEEQDQRLCWEAIVKIDKYSSLALRNPFKPNILIKTILRNFMPIRHEILSTITRIRETTREESLVDLEKILRTH